MDALLDLWRAQPRSVLLGAEEFWDPPKVRQLEKYKKCERVLGPNAHYYNTKTLYNRNEHTGNTFSIYIGSNHN